MQTTAVSVPITVTTPDGTTVATINIRPSIETSHHLCGRITAVTQVPAHRQKLFHAGQELERDARTLEEHGVLGESQLQLVKMWD